MNRETMFLIKSLIKKKLRKYGIYVMRAPSRGSDLSYDLKRYLPNQTFNIIFDVGANIGQSVSFFLDIFPHARIWAFEPSERLYLVLLEKYTKESRVTCEKLALSSVRERSALLAHSLDPTMFYLTDDSSDQEHVCNETVEVEMLDEYCRMNEISIIDLLKIDTEGHDLEVLRGSLGLLKGGRVACIQCECTLDPDNQYHRHLGEVSLFLEPLGYRLFGIYEQTEEWQRDFPNIRRVNSVFVSPSAMHSNRPSSR